MIESYFRSYVLDTAIQFAKQNNCYALLAIVHFVALTSHKTFFE